jgi:hypothetical protein
MKLAKRKRIRLPKPRGPKPPERKRG